MRVFIAVACHNRKRTAELCLPTLKDAAGADDWIHLFNDGSSEYDRDWLIQFGDYVSDVHHLSPIGIEAQRRLHLRMFMESDAEYLYFTDHDAIHDPYSIGEGIRIQKKCGGPLVCLYNTAAHTRLAGNTTADFPSSEVIWRRYAPGISYLLTREHVKELMPHISRITNFDWNIPDILGNQCAISRTSYVDHIGHGGARHPKNEGVEGGDRATNPTEWLKLKRAEIVAKLIDAIPFPAFNFD